MTCNYACLFNYVQAGDWQVGKNNQKNIRTPKLYFDLSQDQALKKTFLRIYSRLPMPDPSQPCGLGMMPPAAGGHRFNNRSKNKSDSEKCIRTNLGPDQDNWTALDQTSQPEATTKKSGLRLPSLRRHVRSGPVAV